MAYDKSRNLDSFTLVLIATTVDSRENANSYFGQKTTAGRIYLPYPFIILKYVNAACVRYLCNNFRQ